MKRRFPAVYKFLNKIHERAFTLSNGFLFATARNMPSIRLTTVGRKSGVERTTMLTSPLVERDEIVLVASYRGGPKNPAWFLNLRDTPEVRAMRRGWNGPMIAEILEGEARERLWNRITALEPRYAKYQSRTERQLPLIVLRPADRERSFLGTV